MVTKLPTHDQVKTEPASLMTGARAKSGKFSGLPIPTKGDKAQSLMLFYKGELVATYHSYRPRPGSAFTWRVASNVSGGAKKTNYSIKSKKATQDILHEYGIHLSNSKEFKFGQGNFMSAINIEYAKVWKRAHPGAGKPTPHEFDSAMFDWLQTNAGRNVVVNVLIPRIKEEVAKGNAGYAKSGARRTIDIDALAAGEESAFSPKRKNKNILNLGAISGAGIAPRRGASRAAPSDQQLENAFEAGIEVGEVAERSRSGSQGSQGSQSGKRTARRGGQ